MPNDCSNYLMLEHDDKSKLEEARAAYRAGKLLAYFVPEPMDRKLRNDWEEQLLLAMKSGDTLAWYLQSKQNDAIIHWRCVNWSTKCDIYENTSEANINGNTLALHFCTAWGPPLAAYDGAKAQHGFRLHAYYNEFNMQFCGEYSPNERELFIYYQSGDEIPDELDRIFSITEEMEARDGEVIGGGLVENE
jgi:hypothetical protein